MTSETRYASAVRDEVRTLPKPYHEAIEHWQRHNFPDYPKLAEEWDRFFPKDEPFCLCAKIAEDIPSEIEVGERKGEEKALAPRELPEEAAQHLLTAIKAQASSMPPMLREEAFHLAAGVIPLRRWVEAAARGDGYITMSDIQRATHKWFGRGLEMFGDERGGQTNVKFGLKDMANREAQDMYIDECQRMYDDLNERYVRARFLKLSRDDAEKAFARIKSGETVDGVGPEDLLRLPDRRFFRRRGEFAYQMVGTHGEAFTDVEKYIGHVLANLPEAYRASIDVKHWADLQRKVTRGETPLKEAINSMPRLARVGGGCPCAKSVRWVQESG